ncbi:hypothetical protein [Patulibacter americanus]|uniref:hypothetical protein n=1 Tax=Patulibacter americanus TaxID=588672 RepID=UPI0003B63958|nr:hypothetical protein [Patulibacter americanus]
MQGIDILVALDLAERRTGDWTVRAVASDLGVAPATVQRAVVRLTATPVVDAVTRRVNTTELERLLVDAVRFVFPAQLGAETRGVPTAWGAAPLSGAIASGESAIPVWPSATGSARGFAIEPLHRAAVALSRDRPSIYGRLVLVDALRLGDARIRGVAGELLRSDLTRVPVS